MKLPGAQREREQNVKDKKIITVTLNPAVDKTCTAQSVRQGEVNRMRSVMRIAGGKGINVTRILRQYGYPVTATGFLGGYNGCFIEEELQKREVICCFVRVQGETRTNMNIVADDGYVTELLEPGPEIPKEKQQDFLQCYDSLLEDGCMVLLSGSVAAGMDKGIYGELVKRARAANIPVYLDSSGESMRQGIRELPDLIKPNWKELEYIMRRRLTSREEVAEAALFLRNQGIGRVIVSMGSKGLLSVTEDGVLHARTERIQAVNTVACGDSVVAAYAMAYRNGETEEEAIRRACAISAANALTMESAEIPMREAETLMERVSIERLR